MSDKPDKPETPETPETGGFFKDLNQWEVPQDFLEATGVKKKLAVSVGRPPKQIFFQVHPQHNLLTLLVELNETRETFIVKPAMRESVAAEFPESIKHARLVFVATKPGNYMVWPLKLQAPDGRSNDWYESAIAGAEEAAKSWVRLVPNMSGNHYDVLLATAALAEPNWPPETWPEILDVAFKGRIIDAEDHAVLRELRGDV
jgi:hypothetical protein